MRVMSYFLLILTLIFGNTMICWAQKKETVQRQNKVSDLEKKKKQIIHGINFVDQDGDRYRDGAPDHDNDGIPNGQDPEYQGAGKGKRQQHFVDRDGDGIDDGRGIGKGYGGSMNKKSGSGKINNDAQVRNGRGYGRGAGNGVCDGTGPKGNVKRDGR